MEQPAILHILRTDNAFRFRLDLPDGPTGQEYSTELTGEIRERSRRLLQSATQFMQSLAWAEMKRQTMKMSAVNDSLLTLGRFLFETLLPAPLQERSEEHTSELQSLRHLVCRLLLEKKKKKNKSVYYLLQVIQKHN